MGCGRSKQKVTPNNLSINVEGTMNYPNSPPSTNNKQSKSKGTTSTFFGRQTRAGTDPNCQGHLLSPKTYFVFYLIFL